MAEDLTRDEHVSEGPLPAPRPQGTLPAPPAPEPTAALKPDEEPETLVTPPRRDWQPGPHAGRFLIAYGLLGIVIGAAVIAFAVFATSRGGSTERQWSAWQPITQGSDRVREIAGHVATQYKLPSGRPLVTVVPRSPEVMTPPVAAAALDDQALFAEERQFSTYDLNDSMLYIFCGGGTDCALSGQPSVDRHLLLRREALELALYTFRYVDDVDSVVTFLPPRPTQAATPQQQQQDPQQQQQMQQQQEPDSALFFRRDDDRVQQLLATPIRELLATRQLSLGMPESEAAIVDEYTLPNLFRYQLQQSPDGQSTILLLSPQPPSS